MARSNEAKALDYNGKVGELGIDLNIDGLFDDTKTPGRTTEQTTVVSADPVDRTIESNTNKTDATIYGIRELSVSNPARRTFLIDLVWKFNEARSKYRGSGAGDKQKARM